MCKVVVEKSGLRPEVADRLTKELDDLIDRIRRRAYALFEERGGKHGSDLEDWLRAEEELLFPAKFELVQEPGSYTLQLALRGFAARNVRVCTLGDAIVVKGEVLEQSCGADEESAKRYRDLFQWWPLPVGAHIGGITRS